MLRKNTFYDNYTTIQICSQIMHLSKSKELTVATGYSYSLLSAVESFTSESTLASSHSKSLHVLRQLLNVSLDSSLK